jgi:hypothetical protein
MGLFRLAILVEGVLLALCGLLSIVVPDAIGAAVQQLGIADTAAPPVLGIAFLALAVLALQVRFDVARLRPLFAVFGFLPVAYMVAIGIAWGFNRLSGPALFWWPVLAVLAMLTVLFWLGMGRIIRQEAPPTPAPAAAPAPGAAPAPLVAEDLTRHDVKMKYAWGWFQYHADQRLKAFNFFLVVFGILIAAYGAAMKEGVSAPGKAHPYEWFCVGVAICGVVISTGFLFIDLRNTELVQVGRHWLDDLERGLGMQVRQHDRERAHLPGAVGPLTGVCMSTKWAVKHQFWFRLIYGMASIGFIIAGFYALRGFTWI